ncbi:BMP family ABC transporter substrate-binding protein [Erysipelothrix urinaevulpis]|uniref:BMP family ABC transporter substrate-binding protein n=1 Tax=Erysipelothrix urinaevulpis TaxID=2683717 RepID=UPI0013568EC9|nr:BMP family ABC transporter substrate-binding protein [Erysipelothrix urinaevulpis]
MKKFKSLLALFVVFMLVLSGCSKEAEKSDNYKVLLLIPGNLGDKSFFDAANRGIEELAKKDGFETKVIEMTTDETKWEPAFLDAIDQDWDLIVSGNAASDLMNELAAKNTEKRFLNFDNSGTDASENVYSVTYATNEGSFLAGAFAALVTQDTSIENINEDKVIGFLGGMDIPGINDFLVGYIQGAQHVDKDVKVVTTYAGDFSDPAIGKELSLAMYSSNVDIAFNVAGQTGLGLIDAAFESNRYAIGVDSDQSALYKDSEPDKAKSVLTSVVKQIDNVIIDSAIKAKEGTLEFGKHELIGLSANAIGLADNEVYQTVPEGIRSQIETIKQDIIDGKIEIESGFKLTTEQISDYRELVKP